MPPFILATHRLLLLLLLLTWSLAGSARGDTALRLELEELVDRAGLVVEARVLAAKGVEDASGIVCTEYTLAVSRTFFGEHQATRTIRLPGGVLADGSGTLVPGFPRLRAGEDVVLLLTDPGRSGWRVPVGAAQGAYFLSIDAQGVRRVDRRLEGLTRVGADGQGSPESDSSSAYADFAQRVERAVAVKRERLEREARDARAGDGR